jgi:hypothetical protein
MSPEARSDKVSLGCGTLILIALIVLFFSRSGNDGLKEEVRSLRTSVDKLTASVEAQSAEIRALREQARREPNAAE